MALFYEEGKFGKIVEYNFLKIGLGRGQRCVYTTYENSTESIEHDMSDLGINVKNFKEMGLLHVVKLGDPQIQEFAKSAEAIEKLILNLVMDYMSPFRLILRLSQNINNDEEARTANLFIERIIHSSFGKYCGSILCPYHVKKIKAILPDELTVNILRYHHNSIFLLKGGRGLAFYQP
jgi:MEDS: MEthanogen/methylotroph, DcmR Sensory domain